MSKRTPVARLVLTILPLTVLCVLYGLWFFSDRPVYIESLVMSLLLTAGFGWFIVRFVPQFLAAVGGHEKPLYVEDGLRMRRRASVRELLLILLFLILFRVMVMAAAYAIHYTLYGYTQTGTIVTMQRFWASYGDAPHYLAIAQKGYVSEAASTNYEYLNLVFLPFYPYCVRVLSFFSDNFVRLGFLVSTAASIAGALVLYLLAKLDYGRSCARRAVAYFCILPAACLLFTTMSDGLFFLLSVLCLYFARREKYWLASIFAALAAYTRLLGIVLIVPLAMEYVGQLVRRVREERLEIDAAFKWRQALNGASLLLIPLALGVYLLQNYLVSGNAFQFLVYQKQNWSQEFSLFFNTAGYQTDYLITSLMERDYEAAFALWLPNILYVFGSLGLMLATMKRMRASYVGYYFAYFFMSVSTSWLLSAPRYLTCCFPVVLAAAILTERRRINYPAVALSGVCFVLYLYAFIAKFPVY